VLDGERLGERMDRQGVARDAGSVSAGSNGASRLNEAVH
jgi:hypothetical protein